MRLTRIPATIVSLALLTLYTVTATVSGGRAPVGNRAAEGSAAGKILDEARRLLENGSFTEAVTMIRGLLVLSPRCRASRALLARALEAQGHARAAQVQWELIVSADNTDARGLWNLADIARRRDDDRTRRRAYRALMALPAQKVSAAVQYAAILSGQGSNDEAMRLLASLKPVGRVERSSVAYNKAMIEKRMGRPERAIRLFRRAIRLSPEFPQAWNNLGITLERAGKASEALDTYRNGIKYCPQYSSLVLNLADCLIETGDSAAAVELLERSLPTLSHARAEVLAVLGRAWGIMGDDEKAGRVLAESLRDRPDRGLTLYNLAVSLANLGRIRESADILNRVDERQVDTTALRVRLGLTRAYTEDESSGAHGTEVGKTGD